MFLRFYFLVPSILVTAAATVSENNGNHTLHRSRRQTSSKLCPPLSAFNTIVTCMLRNEEVACYRDARPGTIAKPKCKRFYKPSPKPEYQRMICLDNGEWDQPVFKCIPECGNSNLNRELILNRINDGRKAGIGAFPWHAGLYYRQDKNGGVTWEQKCSGSLLTDQFVITVAHCVAGTVQNDLRVALGKYYRSWDKTEEGEARRTVLKITYHRDFSINILTFDIAIVQLTEKVEFSDTIMPVCHGFPGVSTYLENKDLFVVGWSVAKEGDRTSSSDTLLYNDVVVVNKEVCRKNIPYIYPALDKFCTMKDNRTKVSRVQPGDTGGGITSVYNELHFIVGAVSARKNQYSIFTNFTWPYHVIWIESEIRKHDSSFRWDENSVTDLLNNGRDCSLPKASSSRRFCSLADGCEDCDKHDKICFIPPGSKVDRVRVVCEPGYTLRNPHNGGDVAMCMNDRWYPEIPECHRYQYVPGNPLTKVTWQEARDFCADKGYMLATIKNKGEQDIFRETYSTFFNSTGIKPASVWIGLSDLTFNKTYEWVDGSTLSKSDFNKWKEGQPSETFYNILPSKYLEQCVEILSESQYESKFFYWNDQYCSDVNYYFCKKIYPSGTFPDKISGDYADNPIQIKPRYKYVPGDPWAKVTWYEARDNCLAKGSQLAIIKTQDQEILFEEERNKYHNRTGTKSDEVWFGLRNVPLKGNIYTHIWTDGPVYNAGKTTPFLHWITHTPLGSISDRCSGITPYWPTDINRSFVYDQWCGDKRNYFCSIKLF